MCDAYNRWLGDVLSGQERLKWWAWSISMMSGGGASSERSEEIGRGGHDDLGTAGDRLLDDPSLLPFYEAVAEADLPLAVHVAGLAHRLIICTRTFTLLASSRFPCRCLWVWCR